MSEIWKPLEREVYKSWCETILTEASDNLTDWERKFVDDLADKLDRYNLSQRQADVLERIYADKTK